MAETLYLVAFENGYVADIGVCFTSEEKADAHAEQVGGFSIPIVRMNRLPKQRTRYTYHTRLARGGVIKRSDYGEHIEWEYEAIYHEDSRTKNYVQGDTLTHEVSLFTSGYEPDGVEEAHKKLIKENGGIVL